MDSVLSGLAVYAVLLLLFRLAGKRSVKDASTSDLLLLLVVGEATQQALVGRDFTVRVAIVLILVLVLVNRLVDYLSSRSASTRRHEKWPLVLVDRGEPLLERMGEARVTPDDVLEEAYRSHGLERLEQIRYALLEESGHIAIIPREHLAGGS